MSEYVDEKGRKKSIGKATDSKLASFITTRGCPYKCTFCSSPTVHGKKLRYRSTENIIAEIKLLHEKYGATLFIPEDDLFYHEKKQVPLKCSPPSETLKSRISRANCPCGYV